MKTEFTPRLNPLVPGCYVRYRGKFWKVDHNNLLDARGHVGLVSLKDSSLGIGAPPDECTPATQEQHDAIEYFVRQAR